MTINLLPRKTWRQRLMKSVHVFIMLTFIANMSMVGVFIQPNAAQAIDWPSDNQWVIPVCNDDPSGDESPNSVDLKASGASEYGAAYFIDADNLYLRERVDGNPKDSNSFREYAWVFMIQKDISTTNYDYLVSLRGSGNGENVELWENTTKNGPIDWSPIFNDPAETLLQSYSTSTNARSTTVGSDYYVDWKIPMSQLTSRGVNLLNSGLYFATSTNANNYNKDHLNCYNAPDIQIQKLIQKNHAGSTFQDGRTASVEAERGDTLTYSVRVTNNGGPATNETFVDELGFGNAADGNQNVNPTSQYSNWTSVLNLNTDSNANSFTGAWGNGSSDGQVNDTLTLNLALLSGGGASESFSFDTVIRNDLTSPSTLLENMAKVQSNSRRSDTDIEVTYNVTNPPLGQACGLDIALVIDSSGSIDSTELTQMKNAFKGFVDAFLPGTPTQFSVTEFDSVASVELAFSGNATTIKNTIGNAVSGGTTNWDDALAKAASTFDPRPAKPNLVVFASDGNANTWGNPGNYDGETAAMPPAIEEANAIKAAGTRIIALGIGDDLDVENLKAISGSNVAPPATVDETADVILADFDTLAAALSDLANELCGGKILVQKQLDTDGDGDIDLDGSQPNIALEGWNFDVNGSPSNPLFQSTTDTGALTFDVENGTYSVAELNQKPNTHIVNGSCVNGVQQVGTFDLGTKTISGLTMGTDETISCTFVNSIDVGSLQVTKVVDAGNLTPDQWSFTINGYGTKTPAPGTDYVVFNNLPTGSYTVTESDETGYHQVSSTCTDVAVANDQQATCVFHNAVDTGSLKVIKYVDTGDATPDMWDFTTNNTTLSPAQGESYVVFNNLLPGNYSVTESNLTDYHQVSTTCTNAAVVGGQETVCEFHNAHDTGSVTVNKKVDTDGDGDIDLVNPQGWTYDMNGFNQNFVMGSSQVVLTGAHTISEDQQAGYHVVGWTCNNGQQGAGTSIQANVTTNGLVCEFRNVRDTGSLTVIKHVEGGDLLASDWTMHIKQGDNEVASFPGNESGVLTALPTGDYKVVETGDMTNYGYVYQGDCDVDGNISIGYGESKTCTIFNFRYTGDITVNKFVQYPDGQPVQNPADWSWDINGGSALPGGQTEEIDINVLYTIAEDTTHYPADNFTTTWVCYNGDELVAQGAGTSFDVTLTHAEESLVCTFTNVRDTTRVIFDKVVIGGDPGTEDDWSFTIGGVPGSFGDGDAVTLLTNETYDVTESSSYDNLYTLTGASGVCSLVNGQIVMNTGAQGGTCVVENTRDTGTIDGTKFNDTNGDGTWDAGEPGVPGVTINLSNGWTTSTDGNGNYVFNDVPTGTYSASEVVPADWTNTTPNPVNNVVVVDGQTTTANFGNFEYATVTVCKYIDVNGDGAIDGDPLYTADGGWRVRVHGVPQYTDDGCATFTNIGPGTFQIDEEQKDGWSQTMPGSGVYFYTSVSGDEVTYDFANFQLGKISGYKFNDLDGNGTWDNGEPPIQNWQMNLTGQHSAFVYTDVNGYYEFTGLEAGTFAVAEENVAGWTRTTSPASYDVNIVSGTVSENSTFGNFENIDVTVCKYIDVNGDGFLTDEPPYEDGWNVNLNDDQRVTSENGCVTYANVGPGNYDITENTNSDWIQTYPAEGSYNFSAASGQDETFNFGNFKLGSIYGYKLNAQENPLSDWKICLSGGSIDEEGEDVDFGVDCHIDYTDENGYYEFDGLTAGEYSVAEKLQYGWTAIDPASGEYTGIGITSGADEQRDFMNQLNEFDLIIDKSADETVLAGDQLTYTLDWSVTGNTDVSNVMITDELPADTTFVSADNGGTYDSGTNTVSWDLGMKTPDANGTVSFIVAIDSPLYNGTEIENEAEICGEGELVVAAEAEEEPTEKCDDDSTTTEVESDFTVDIEKTGPETAEAGADVTYTLSWEVTGNSPIDNLIITDNVPTDTTFVSADNGGTETAGVVTWDLGSANPGDSGSVTMTVNVTAPQYNGTEVLNTGEICGSAESFTEEEIIEHCDEDDTTTTVESDFTVSIDKTGPETAEAGSDIVYTLSWEITGNSPVDEVIITDAVPANTAFVSADNSGTESLGVVTWNLGAKNPGESGQVTMTVTINTPIVDGTVITNTGEICGSTDTFTEEEVIEHCDDDTTTTTVESEAVIGLTKEADKPVVNPADEIVFTMNWSVGGTSPITNLTLVDPIPDNAMFVSADNGGTYDSVTNIVTWNLGNHNPGDAGQVMMTVLAETPLADGTVITNTATLDSDETDPAVSATALVTVQSGPVLEITKLVDKQKVNPGATLTYTVVVTNTGDDTAHNVVITDTLPNGFTFADTGEATKTFNLGEIAPDASVSTTYEVTVGQDATAGIHENLATASSDNYPDVTAKAPVEVIIPQILGEKTPDLAISKTVSVAFANPGNTVTYTVVIENLGDGEAENVMLQDILPAGFSFKDSTNSKTWSLGNLLPGEKREVAYEVVINKDVKAGAYENLAVTWADNNPNVIAKVPLEVRVPKVLGEKLPVTGASMLELGFILFIALVVLFATGTLWVARKEA